MTPWKWLWPVALAMFFTPACAADLELRGVRVDAQADCAYIRSLERRSGTFAAACETRRPMWITEVSFLDKVASMAVHQNAEGIVTAVIVTEFDFDTALAALEVKFGEPSIERSLVQNRMGASFENIEATWKARGQRMVLRKHSSKVGRAMLALMGSTFAKDTLDERAKKATAGASNI